jgi:hypothetical protein
LILQENDVPVAHVVFNFITTTGFDVPVLRNDIKKPPVDEAARTMTGCMQSVSIVMGSPTAEAD